MTYKGFNAPVSLTYAVATTYCAADALDKCKSLKTSFFLFYRVLHVFIQCFWAEVESPDQQVRGRVAQIYF